MTGVASGVTMRVEIRNTINPTPWRELYARMRRWRYRMDTSGTDDNLVDATHAFFITCFQLRDWLKADASVPLSVGDAASTLVNTDDALRLCADLANGAKHLVLTQSPKLGVPLSMSTDPPQTVRDDTTGASLGEATVIADRCLATWDRFLRA